MITMINSLNELEKFVLENRRFNGIFLNEDYICGEMLSLPYFSTALEIDEYYSLQKAMDYTMKSTLSQLMSKYVMVIVDKMVNMDVNTDQVTLVNGLFEEMCQRITQDSNVVSKQMISAVKAWEVVAYNPDKTGTFPDKGQLKQMMTLCYQAMLQHNACVLNTLKYRENRDNLDSLYMMVMHHRNELKDSVRSFSNKLLRQMLEIWTEKTSDEVLEGMEELYSDDDEYPYADKPKQLIYSRNYVKSESSVVTSNAGEDQSVRTSGSKPDGQMFMFMTGPKRTDESASESETDLTWHEIGDNGEIMPEKDDAY